MYLAQTKSSCTRQRPSDRSDLYKISYRQHLSGPFHCVFSALYIKLVREVGTMSVLETNNIFWLKRRSKALWQVPDEIGAELFNHNWECAIERILIQ